MPVLREKRVLRRIVILILVLGVPLSLGFHGLRKFALNRSLVAAIEIGDTAEALDLIRRGADPESRKESETARTPREQLIALWNHLRGRPYMDKTTPSALMLAVASNQTDVALALLKAGASGVDERVVIDEWSYATVQENHTKPLLVVAATNGNIALVRALLDRGAHLENMTLVDAKPLGETALMAATYLNSSLYADKKESVAERKAREQRYLAIFRLLLERGARFDGRNDVYPSVLCSAVAHNAEEEVALLLAHGVDPNSTPWYPPLHLAVQNDNLALVKALFAAGAKIDPKDTAHSPLAYTTDVTLLRLLREHGANVQGLGYYGRAQSALIQAVRKNALPAVSYLLSQGADPNERALRNTTPLMIAAQESSLPVVRCLLDHGADPHLRNFSGQSALGFAAGNPDQNVAALLRQRSR